MKSINTNNGSCENTLQYEFMIFFIEINCNEPQIGLYVEIQWTFVINRNRRSAALAFTSVFPDCVVPF